MMPELLRYFWYSVFILIQKLTYKPLRKISLKGVFNFSTIDFHSTSALAHCTLILLKSQQVLMCQFSLLPISRLMMWTSESAWDLCLLETVLEEWVGSLLFFAFCPRTAWYLDYFHLSGHGGSGFAGTVTDTFLFLWK